MCVFACVCVRTHATAICVSVYTHLPLVIWFRAAKLSFLPPCFRCWQVQDLAGAGDVGCEIREGWWFSKDPGFVRRRGWHPMWLRALCGLRCVLTASGLPLLCPSMSFDTLLPSYLPCLPPQPCLVLPLSLFGISEAAPALGIRELVCAPPSPSFGVSRSLASASRRGQLSTEELGGEWACHAEAEQGSLVTRFLSRDAVEPTVCVVLGFLWCRWA